MDAELDNYVNKVMNEQKYRNGIFNSWIQTIVNAIADYRGAPDIRGSYINRGE